MSETRLAQAAALQEVKGRFGAPPGASSGVIPSDDEAFLDRNPADRTLRYHAT